MNIRKLLILSGIVLGLTVGATNAAPDAMAQKSNCWKCNTVEDVCTNVGPLAPPLYTECFDFGGLPCTTGNTECPQNFADLDVTLTGVVRGLVSQQRATSEGDVESRTCAGALIGIRKSASELARESTEISQISL